MSACTDPGHDLPYVEPQVHPWENGRVHTIRLAPCEICYPTEDDE